MADEPNEDLSMDDILSSIRNILTEDNAAQQAASEPAAMQPGQEILPEEVPVAFEAVPEDVLSVDLPVLPDVAEEITLPEIVSENMMPAELPVLPDVTEEIELPEAEEEVFELSASMIIDELPSEEPVELNILDEPEISESDILNFSNLAAGTTADIEMPAEVPFEIEESLKPEPVSVFEPEANPEPVSVFEPEVSPMAIQAPLASEVLAEEEPEVSFDDIASLSSLIEAPESAVIPAEEPQPAIPSLDFDLPEIDVDADPIFEPESTAAPEMDPSQLMESLTVAEDVLPQEQETVQEESVIDDDTLNEILDFHAQVEETKPLQAEPEEVFVAVAEPELPAETANINQEVLAEPMIAASEPQELQTEIAETPQDSADVSANIINNFAKLFAEKKAAEAIVTPVAEAPQEAVKTASPSISELVREAVVKQVTQQMDVNFESYAREAVAAQTQAWLDANLPAIVEAVVSKEIERVMAKVGS